MLPAACLPAPGRCLPASVSYSAHPLQRFPLLRLFTSSSVTREKVIAFLVPEKVKEKVCWVHPFRSEA